MAPAGTTIAVAVSLLGASGALVTWMVHEEHRKLSSSEESTMPWTYGENAGDGEAPYAPEQWGELYPDCYGHGQSPINLTPGVETKVPSSHFDLDFWADVCYSYDISFHAGDHSWMINTEECEEPSRLTFKNETYKLVNVHWHSVSEHTSGWSCHDMEMHMVHVKEDDSGSLLVVGVFIDGISVGLNLKMANMWEVFMTKEEEWDGEVFSISPYELVPADPAYSAYNGSLTTPPCSEGVQWIVMSAPILISETQLTMFRHAMAPYHRVNSEGGTNRPIQSLNGRDVFFVG